MSRWVSTASAHTDEYYGRSLIMGQHYTLVAPPLEYDIRTLTYLLGQHRIVSHAFVDKVVHVLVQVTSKEDGDLLRAHFTALAGNHYVASEHSVYSISYLMGDDITYGFMTTLG
jgi:hypothetical protein